VYPSGDTVYSDYGTLNELGNASDHYLNCPAQPSICGNAPTGCWGESGFVNVAIRLQRGDGVFVTSYVAYSDDMGNFIFNGDSLYPSLDTSQNYRLIADYPFGEDTYSSWGTPRELSAVFHNMECPPRNITGIVGVNCLDSLNDIEIYLEDGVPNHVNYNVYSDTQGRFIFEWDSLVQVTDPYTNYRIVALVPSDTKYTDYKSIHELVFLSSHYLGCTMDKKGKDVIKDPTPSLNQINNSSEIKLYPNPAFTVLNIKSLGNVSKVRIISIIGQEVLNTNESSQIDISNIAEGMYHVELFDGNGRILHQQKICIIHR
jgi:hypothetical protein